MIEILNDKEGYFYCKEKEEEEVFLRSIKYKVVNEEIIRDIKIKTIDIIEINHSIISEKLFLDFHSFKYLCKHKNKINYTSINRLPNSYWEELIECWSCHNNEFKSMKDLKIRPREKGILVSLLYILVLDDILPDCCKDGSSKVRKIYFNDLNISVVVSEDDVTNNDLRRISNMYFIYHYLVEYFKLNSRYVYRYEGNVFEVKYLHKSYLCMREDNLLKKYNCIKVGMKKSSKIVELGNDINEFFIRFLHENITLIGIKGLGYEFGFVVEKIFE